MCDRASLKQKKRIVVKVGSSSLVHEETGLMDLFKLEQLVRILCDLRNQGKEVVLVSSGAIGAGRRVLGLNERPSTLPMKQACASVGQGALIGLYQRLFNEYHQVSSQILMTKHTIIREKSVFNAKNTFNQLLKMGVIPIVNENDTVSTDEIEFGDIFKVLFKEIRIALLAGFLLAIVNGIRIVLMYKDPMLAFAVGLTLMCTVILSKTIGCSLPLIAKKCGLDPAIMAAPLITTLVDTGTIFVYFTIVTRIFHI